MIRSLYPYSIYKTDRSGDIEIASDIRIADKYKEVMQIGGDTIIYYNYEPIAFRIVISNKEVMNVVIYSDFPFNNEVHNAENSLCNSTQE